MFYKKRRGVEKPKKTIFKKRLYRKKMPVVSVNAVRTMVKTELAKNVENKMTSITHVGPSPVCTISSVGVINWYNINNWHQKIWSLPQGSGQSQRIGNKIKIKRWIIKGQIAPNFPGIAFLENLFLNRSYQGYLTLFFGRRKDIGAIDGSLFQLLDSGSGSTAPSGTSAEMMYPVNTDVYKIYWRKTFKMGASYGPNASVQQSPNNEFSLTRTFGLDVTKYIMKNKILTYNDTDQTSADRDLQRLAVWAIWRPAIGSLSNPNQGVALTNSFYEINLTSYGEYEDA
jgi:hypothetical protein